MHVQGSSSHVIELQYVNRNILAYLIEPSEYFLIPTIIEWNILFFSSEFAGFPISINAWNFIHIIYAKEYLIPLHP